MWIQYGQLVVKEPYTLHNSHDIKKLSPHKGKDYPQVIRTKKWLYARENNVIHLYNPPTTTTNYI